MKAVTTTTKHGLQPGDRISMDLMLPDRRWWRRLWFFVTRRGRPYRMQRRVFTVDSMLGDSKTTFSIKP